MIDVRNTNQKLVCRVGKVDVVEIIKDGITTTIILYADGRVEIINSPKRKAV